MPFFESQITYTNSKAELVACTKVETMCYLNTAKFLEKMYINYLFMMKIIFLPLSSLLIIEKYVDIEQTC